MQKKQLIIFDMDGTLIDSGNIITNTINYVRNNIGLDSIPKQEMLSQLNNPDINASEFFYGTTSFTDEQTILFTQYYEKNCISDIILYDGIQEMLEIVSSHFQLTVATNASVEFANKMLKHLNIDEHFDMVIGANCVEKPKPHPDMILKTLDTLNINHKHSILVGDSHKDLRAANAANVDNILVNWGFTQYNKNEAITTTKELTHKLLSFR